MALSKNSPQKKSCYIWLSESYWGITVMMHCCLWSTFRQFAGEAGVNKWSFCQSRFSLRRTTLPFYHKGNPSTYIKNLWVYGARHEVFPVHGPSLTQKSQEVVKAPISNPGPFQDRCTCCNGWFLLLAGTTFLSSHSSESTQVFTEQVSSFTV